MKKNVRNSSYQRDSLNKRILKGEKMRKVRSLFFAGLLLLLLGIYLSTLSLTHWIIIGTLLAIIGGFLMGGSTYFIPKSKK